MKLRFISLLIVVLFFLSDAALAQFEGNFRISAYTIGDENETLINRNHITVSPNRIMFNDMQNIRTLDALMGMKVKRVLLRNDRKDFVFIGDKQAITLGQQQLLALTNMFKTMQQQSGQTVQSNNPEFDLRQTDETRQINGINTKKWVAESDDVAVNYHLWLTDTYKINWGLLAEPWLADIGFFQGMPDLSWMADQKTPLLIERFDNYKLSEVIRFDNFNMRSVSEAELAIPEGVQTITFQQFLMNRMSQQ